MPQRARSKASPAGACDAISAVSGNPAAGLVTVWVCAHRKSCEYADGRNDAAEIQANEIRRNMGALNCGVGGRFACVPTTTPPSPRVYRALSLGNIRHFDGNLQDLPDRTRSDLETSPLALDIARRTKALERLEMVKNGRDRHFAALPGWRRPARRKLRSAKSDRGGKGRSARTARMNSIAVAPLLRGAVHAHFPRPDVGWECVGGRKGGPPSPSRPRLPPTCSPPLAPDAG